MTELPAAKPRPRLERVLVVLQPLADRLVRRAARAGVNPLAVLAVHALAGLLAAALLAWGGWAPEARAWAFPAAALLLVAKAILDNVDGGLARVSGRITRLGRYADTGADLLGNAALCLALATFLPATVAVWTFLALTASLSLDANLEALYREARDADTAGTEGDLQGLPLGGPAWLEASFRGLYRITLAPQDRAVRALDRFAFRRLTGTGYEAAPRTLRLAWSDLFSTASVVDLGLTTQMLVLAGALALGVPALWPVFVSFGFLWALAAQGIRALRFRRRLLA